jgi:DHA3 family tetracycline resistance protein-like MFS transporter
VPGPARVYLIAVTGWEFCFALWATVAVVRRVTTLGFDPLELVLIGTALEFSAFVFEVPTGVVADTYSRRASVAIGYALMGLGFAFEALSWGFAAVLAAQIVWGCGWTFISGAREAWIADEAGEAEAARLFLRAAQLGIGATLLGIGLGVALATWDFQLPMLLGAAGLAALALWLRVALREPNFRPASGHGWRAFAGTLSSGIGAVRGRPALLMLMGIAILTGAASEGMDRLREYHLLHAFEFPIAFGLKPVHLFGLLNAAALLLGLGLVSLLQRNVDPTRVQVLPRLLTGAYALMTAAVLMFALAGEFVLAFAAWCVFAAVRRAREPFITAWLNHRLDPSVRATVLSLHGQSGALGEMSGGPVLGLFAQLFAVRAALVGAAAILLPALALFAREARRTRQA